ncbi:MAG: EAL domain-containing protein [Robiginitomaculum sp.]|nr:EAL domain-containing protein [Robiginitomaculum sp.]
MTDLKIVHDIATEKGFRAHISQNRFTIMRQPVISVSTNAVLHDEWLVRFDSDTGLERILRPAEISGAISELDLSMLRQAVKRLNDQPKRTAIAVNLSGASFSDPAFERTLFATLAHLKAKPEKLLFELTETWNLKDLQPAIRILNILRERGHNLCLDDVGAGAASLRYLRALPADWLKIDGEFVSGAASNAQELTVLKAVLGLRKGLGVKFIAEGIETQRLLDFAKDIGFDAVQGYILGAPEPEHPA